MLAKLFREHQLLDQGLDLLGDQLAVLAVAIEYTEQRPRRAQRQHEVRVLLIVVSESPPVRARTCVQSDATPPTPESRRPPGQVR